MKIKKILMILTLGILARDAMSSTPTELIGKIPSNPSLTDADSCNNAVLTLSKSTNDCLEAINKLDSPNDRYSSLNDLLGKLNSVQPKYDGAVNSASIKARIVNLTLSSLRKQVQSEVDKYVLQGAQQAKPISDEQTKVNTTLQAILYNPVLSTADFDTNVKTVRALVNNCLLAIGNLPVQERSDWLSSLWTKVSNMRPLHDGSRADDVKNLLDDLKAQVQTAISRTQAGG